MRKLFLGALVTLAACASDSTTAPTSTIAGSWTLQTVNGSALPVVLAQAPLIKVELLSDVVIISGTGSLTRTTSVRSTIGGQITTESFGDTGKYTLTGSAVAMQFENDGATGAGSWSGNTITLTDDEGGVFVYKR